MPQLSQLPHCTRQVPRSLDSRQNNFWYEQARHLLANQFFKHLQEKKYSKMPQHSGRDHVSHIEFLYGSEENFLSTKINPNITGTSNRPNCSGISRLNNSPAPKQTNSICRILWLWKSHVNVSSFYNHHKV